MAGNMSPQSLFITDGFKKSVYTMIAACGLFFLYPYMLSLGAVSLIVYFIQIVICIVAFNKYTWKFTEDKVARFAPQYKKDKRIIVFLLILILILDQFPIVAFSIYPSLPPETGELSNWDIWYENRPGVGVVLLSILMSIAEIFAIFYVLNECKNPDEMLSTYIKEQERRKQNQIRADKEKERKNALYGGGYITSCAGVVFSKDKDRMWINEVEFNPEEILSIDVDDISTTTQLPQEVKTKTSTGSMIGRGLVGAALLGPAGAIIGGATAKKKSIISEGKIITNYRYKLRITTSKNNQELISYTSSNLDSIRHCQSLISAFVHRNKG